MNRNKSCGIPRPVRSASLSRPREKARGLSIASTLDIRPRSSSGSRLSFNSTLGRPSVTPNRKIFTSSRPSEIERRQTLKDIRPLSDKPYQRESIIKLHQFLVDFNYTPLIPIKNLACPSGSDFHRIFEFMYQKLSPGFVLSKQPVEEIPVLVRNLRYPFIITKSQLLNPGSRQAWGHLLGFLCWFVDGIRYFNNFEVSPQPPFILDGAQSDDVFESCNLNNFFHRIVFESFNKSLRSELNEEELENYYEQLARNIYGNPEQVEDIKMKSQAIEDQMREIKDQFRAFEITKEKMDGMHLDTIKLRQYNEDSEKYLALRKMNNQHLLQKKESQGAVLEVLTKELNEAQAILDQQRASGINLKMMHLQQRQLDSDLQNEKIKLEKIRQIKWDKELEQFNAHKDFKIVCDNYQQLMEEVLANLQNHQDIYQTLHPKDLKLLKTAPDQLILKGGKLAQNLKTLTIQINDRLSEKLLERKAMNNSEEQLTLQMNKRKEVLTYDLEDVIARKVRAEKIHKIADQDFQIKFQENRIKIGKLEEAIDNQQKTIQCAELQELATLEKECEQADLELELLKKQKTLETDKLIDKVHTKCSAAKKDYEEIVHCCKLFLARCKVDMEENGLEMSQIIKDFSYPTSD